MTRSFSLRTLPALLAASFQLAGSALAQVPNQPLKTVSPPAVQQAAPAQTTALEQREIRAQLTPRRQTTLAAEIGAKVNRLNVKEGGSFTSGQTLLVFDCSVQQAQLNKAKASLNAAGKTWDANKRLAELNSIGTVELQLSEAEVLKNKADVASMSAMLSKCAISAPFSGRVSEQKVQEQQYVQPGQALLEILDDSVLEIEFIAPSRWLAWLQKDYLFSIIVDETGNRYPARIQRIGARVDPVSQSVKLFGAIDGKFPELISGMSGHVDLAPPAGK